MKPWEKQESPSRPDRAGSPPLPEQAESPGLPGLPGSQAPAPGVPVLANPKVQAAARLSARLHRGQFRKHSAEPYFVHPAAVARRVVTLLERFRDECDDLREEDLVNLACSAYLHDTVEDCGLSLDQVEKEFGNEVAKMVAALTNPPGMTKKEKRDYLVGKIPKMERKIRWIKLADRENNVQDLNNLKDVDPDFTRRYALETRAILKVLGDSSMENDPVRDVLVESISSIIGQVLAAIDGQDRAGTRGFDS